MQVTLLIAFVLVILVIFVFLGRATDTLIPVVALPLSLLVTFLAMWALDYSINNLTLMALTLAIGFLVDDAIVFLENVVRRAEHGESIYKATLNSAGEISFTILSMTLSLAAVFIPLVFMPGLLGRIFREFAITIIVAIFASGSDLAHPDAADVRAPLARTRPGSSEDLDGALHRTASSIRSCVSTAARSIGSSITAGWRLPILALCALGLWFFFYVACPLRSCRRAIAASSAALLLMQEGASPQQQRLMQDKLDPVLQANPAVDKYFTVAGQRTRRIVRNLYRPVSEAGARSATPIDEVAMQLRKALSEIPGIFPTLNPQPVLQINIGATGSAFGRYSYAISGINPDEVYAAADALSEKFKSYPGFAAPPRSNLFRNQPNIDIDIDRDRASIYGVSTTKLQNLLRAAYSQNYVYLIKEADDQYQVILEVDDADRAGPEDLRQLYVEPDGKDTLIPVRTLTKFSHQARAAIRQSHQSIHQRHLRLRHQTGCRARRCHRLHRKSGGRSPCRRP